MSGSLGSCVHVAEEASTLRLGLRREEVAASRQHSRSGIRQNFDLFPRRTSFHRPPKVWRLPLRRASTMLCRCPWPNAVSSTSNSHGLDIQTPPDSEPDAYSNRSSTRSSIGFDLFSVVSVIRNSKPNPCPSGNLLRSNSAGVLATCFAKPSR